MISNVVLHDAIALTQNVCSVGRAAQVFRCFAEHGKSSPLMASAPFEIQPDDLLLAFQLQQQATFGAVALNPRSCPGPMLQLCTYHRWVSCPGDQIRQAEKSSRKRKRERIDLRPRSQQD